MAEFYAVVRKKEPEPESLALIRRKTAEDFYESVLVSERSESSRAAKGEIGFSMRPGLVERIARLVPPGVLATGSVLDVGSGYGAVVGYFAVVDPSARDVVGIELVPERVDESKSLLSVLEKKAAGSGLTVASWSVIQGDLREELKEEDTWTELFDEANVVISNNFVFDEDSNRALVDRLFAELNEAEVGRSLYVFTTSPLVNVRTFERGSWQRFHKSERFAVLDPDRKATFEDFVKEVYVVPIVEPGMVTWSDAPKDLFLYGIRLTNEDVLTDGAFFESFLSCDAFLYMGGIPLKARVKLEKRCKSAWKYGVSVLDDERDKDALVRLFDTFIAERGEPQVAKLIMDVFEENLPGFDGEEFLLDWHFYTMGRTEPNQRLAGLLGEKLDIMISASYRVATAEEEEEMEEEEAEELILSNEEEQTLTPEIREAVQRYFDPKTSIPPELEVREVSKALGRGVFAKEPMDEDWGARMGGEVVFLTSQKVDKIVTEKGAIYLTEVRGRFAPADIERTVWVDPKEHWSGLLNHGWNSPIPMEDHPCPKVFANVNVDEEGNMHTLRRIEVGEQLTWDYGTHYWTAKGKTPFWNVSDLTKKCLEIPELREVVAGLLDVSDFHPPKAFLLELEAEAREEEAAEEAEEEGSFELSIADVSRIMARRAIMFQAGVVTEQEQRRKLGLSKRGWMILKILDKALTGKNLKMRKLTDEQFEAVLVELLAAQERGELGKGEKISGKKVRKILDDLVAKERARKKTKTFPFSPAKEVEDYERAVQSTTGLVPETNVAERVLGGKEEERRPPEEEKPPLSPEKLETEVDSANELAKISRRLKVLWQWYKSFADRLSAVPSFAPVVKDFGVDFYLEDIVPREDVASRDDHFVLLEMSGAFLALLSRITEESRTYETNDERVAKKALDQAREEALKFAQGAFDVTGINNKGQAYWKPTSDAAVIRAGGKLQNFLKELSKKLSSAAESATGQDLSEPLPPVAPKDGAWAHGGTKEVEISPKKPGKARRKIVVSAQTREKRKLARRNETMLDIVRAEFKCPVPQEGESRPPELRSDQVMNLAEVLAEREIEGLYDFDAQCGLLAYALAARHGISVRIGCYDSRVYKYHDQVADFLVEQELLELRPDAKIAGGIYDPNFAGISHLFVRKIPKEKSERWLGSVERASRVLASKMIVVSVNERKELESVGFDLGERVTRRERSLGMNVYFHEPPRRRRKKKKKHRKRKKARRSSLIDLTEDSPPFVVDLTEEEESTKGKGELATESITIFSEKPRGEERARMSTIAFGKPKKEEEEEKVEAKASGAVSYAKSFDYDDGGVDDVSDKEDNAEEEEEELIRAQARMDDSSEESGDEESLLKDEERVRQAIAAVRLPFGEVEEEGEAEEEGEGETNAAVKIPGVRRFGDTPYGYLKDAKSVHDKYSKKKGRWKKSDLDSMSRKIKVLKARALKQSIKIPQETRVQEMLSIGTEFDTMYDDIRGDILSAKVAAKASGKLEARSALPSGASKKFEKTQDLHVHHMQIQPGQTTNLVEDTPHELMLQATDGEAHANLKYVNSEGALVETTKTVKDRGNLIIPKGASYSLSASEGHAPTVIFVSPAKY